MIINKAQVQTLDKVGLHLPKLAFNYGQLFLAISRVRSFEKIKMQILPNNQKDTMNIVYKKKSMIIYKFVEFSFTYQFFCIE
jgi:hypothetical protein